MPPVNESDWSGWVWPVPISNGRPPVISHEFEDGNPLNPDGTLNYAVHKGVDLMFQREKTDPTGPADTVAQSKRFISPPGTLVIAAGPGKIWAAGTTPLGHFVQIDHGNVGSFGPADTFYQHLISFQHDWKKGDVVKAGDVLGVMGGDPANPPHLRHLHFELWAPKAGVDMNLWRINPAPYMRFWRKVTVQEPIV